MLLVNQVVKINNTLYRIVWQDNQHFAWIDIHDTKAVPVIKEIDNYEEMILTSEIEEAEDPFLSHVLTPPVEGSTAWHKRENAWRVIKDVVNNEELLYADRRGPMVLELMQQHQVTKQTLYRYLRRYWQRGLNKNSLLPDYDNSGAAGKTRQQKNTKLGRPRAISKGTGSLVTVDVERIFRISIERIFLKENNASLKHAYRKMLDLFTIRKPNTKNMDLPTFWQFRYFYRREYSPVEVMKKRVTPVIYAKDIRPLHGTSNADVLGPGSRYQIDATIADIYLLSEEDRTRIVGRPVLYFVKDVFSRMVTGLYIGFEGPSWVSAMMALANTVEDKVAYCAQFDIHINSEDWPTQGLPDAILADRGELLGHHIEVISRAFNVRIENAPPYRGDAKGIVERYFRTIQEEFKPYVDGVVTGKIGKKRAGNDYRLDATLTLYEFTQIILHCVLWHNGQRTLSKYDREADMPTDLPAVPLELWNWGISNKTGHLRNYDTNLVRINLLPHKNATVSELGIKLFGCIYTCSEALKEGWFDRIKGNRPGTVLVAYDPRRSDQIYLRPDKNLHEYWVCELTDRSRRFRGMSFWDVWQLNHQERKTQANSAIASDVSQSQLDSTIQDITKGARSKKPSSAGMTKAERTRNIRQNHADEKELERDRTALTVKNRKSKQTAEVVPIRDGQENEHSYPDMIDTLFEDNADE